MPLHQQHEGTKQQTAQRFRMKKHFYIGLCLLCLLPALGGCGRESLPASDAAAWQAAITQEPRTKAFAGMASRNHKCD